MGHKAVAVFDLDVLDLIEKDPALFAKRMKDAILTHRRLGGAVSLGGATVAHVVWSGHADQKPILKFIDFRADDLSPVVSDKINLPDDMLDEQLRQLLSQGLRVEAVRLYRSRTGGSLRQATHYLTKFEGV
jgi:hypothetical protein